MFGAVLFISLAIIIGVKFIIKDALKCNFEWIKGTAGINQDQYSMVSNFF